MLNGLFMGLSCDHVTSSIMSSLWLLDQKHTTDCILETVKAKVSVKRSKRQ